MRERFLSLKVLFAVMMMLTLASSASAATYSETVIADNPDGYYKLDSVGLNGAVANSHGSGEAGTAGAGVTFGHPGAGPSTGTSAYFDGDVSNGSLIRILDTNHALDLVTGTPFSVEYWMKPETLPSGANAHVVSRSCSGAGCSPTGADAFVVNSPSGGVLFHTDGWAGGKHRADTPGGVVDVANNAGAWYHVVATYNGSDTQAVYVNGGTLAGGVQATGTINKPLGAAPDGDWFFGTLGDGTIAKTDDYKGYIDEVAIYSSVALSAEQVAAHYAAVPEPSTIVLLVFGPAMLWVLRRSR